MKWYKTSYRRNKERTQELKRNIYSKEFEEFRLKFPHARQWKKNETYDYFKKQDKNLINTRLNHLKRCIRAWIQDPKYIQASQRRVRDLTPLDDWVLDVQLRQIIKRHMNTEWKAERFKELSEFYWADNINKILKEQKKDLTIKTY